MDNTELPTTSTIKPVTQIKYNKTSCYFCNEWLENDNFKVSNYSATFSVLKFIFF